MQRMMFSELQLEVISKVYEDNITLDKVLNHLDTHPKVKPIRCDVDFIWEQLSSTWSSLKIAQQSAEYSLRIEKTNRAIISLVDAARSLSQAKKEENNE